MAEHRCTCVGCDESLRLLSSRIVDANRFTVRWWQDSRNRSVRMHGRTSRISFRVDGCPVTDVDEAMLGEHGYVLGHSRDDDGKLHDCQTCVQRLTVTEQTGDGYYVSADADGREVLIRCNPCQYRIDGHVEVVV